MSLQIKIETDSLRIIFTEGNNNNNRHHHHHHDRHYDNDDDDMMMSILHRFLEFEITFQDRILCSTDMHSVSYNVTLHGFHA